VAALQPAVVGRAAGFAGSDFDHDDFRFELMECGHPGRPA